MSANPNVAESESRPCEVTTRYGRLMVPDIENDLIGRFLSRYGEWGWLEAVFVASVIPDGARILDVGAFVGTFGLAVAQLRPLEFVCFVEANGYLAPLLESNVAVNAPCPSLVREALVAGPEARAGAGHSLPGNFGSMSFSVDLDPDSLSVIRSVTLADLRTEHGAFDLIKLDIEGMELDALRGDLDFLAQGKTTLWIEANEDVRSLEVASLLLSANLELFYFAFPAFNPKNFNGDPEPVFVFAFEAGLLAAPASHPSLSRTLIDAGCILKPVHCLDDLKDALWRTPRWGMTEWQGAENIQELAALVGRSILGESFAVFLTRESGVSPGAKTTIWHRLDTAQAALQDARVELTLAEDALRRAKTLAAERSNALEAVHLRREQTEAALRAATTLAAERLHQLEAEDLWRRRTEATLQAAAALAMERLQQLDAERQRRERTEEALRYAATLALERLDQLHASRTELDVIRSSTVWRVSRPLRGLVTRLPALRAVLRRTRTVLGVVVRRLRGQAMIAPAQVPAEPAMAQPTREQPDPVQPDRIPPTAARSMAPVDPNQREAARLYFDTAYYLAVNPEVAAAGVDPLDHFIQQGWREGRAPGPAFDVAYYLEANPDVAAAGTNPVVHYVWAGKAEGRLPRRETDVRRLHLGAAASPRERAAEWGGAVDRSTPLSPAALAAALCARRGAAGTVVSVSHDDYGTNFGGIQNLITDEQQAFAAAGWRYLHISPAAPLPILADCGPAENYRLRLRLDGKAIGVAAFPDLATALGQSRGSGARLVFVFHHLLGHVPEWLATLPAAADARPIVWIHDFFTLCPGFTLLRNDVTFCGAPPARSAACTICVYGDERQDHIARMQAFFEVVDPAVLAPSAVALDFWRSRRLHPHAGTAVVPPARLTMDKDVEPIAMSGDAPLRVAHLGGVSVHKGWSTFEQLVAAHIGDPRYEFYHLGLGGTPSSRYIRDPVRVSAAQRDAMIEAVTRHRIDVVINWSVWPETFCFAVHEALAGGAFVVARQAAGNVWPAIDANAPAQGCAVADEASLFQLFQSGEIRTRVARTRRQRGRLHPGGSTAEYLLHDRTATTALRLTGALHL